MIIGILLAIYGLFCIIAHHRLHELFNTNEVYQKNMIDFMRQAHDNDPLLKVSSKGLTDEDFIDMYNHLMEKPWVWVLWSHPPTALWLNPFGCVRGAVNGNYPWF